MPDEETAKTQVNPDETRYKLGTHQPIVEKRLWESYKGHNNTNTLIPPISVLIKEMNYPSAPSKRQIIGPGFVSPR